MTFFKTRDTRSTNTDFAKDSYKIVLVGNGGVGKTTFIKRHITGEFERNYEPTKGCCIYPLNFNTSCGHIKFSVWDTAGQEKFGGLRDGYYVGADAAIIMFDVSSRISYKQIPSWYRDIRRVESDIPVILIGNKIDINDRQVKDKNVKFHRRKNIPYIPISTKSNYNYEKPFLCIARKIADNKELRLVEQPAIKPPTSNFTPEELRKIKEDEIYATQTAIPDDEADW